MRRSKPFSLAKHDALNNRFPVLPIKEGIMPQSQPLSAAEQDYFEYCTQRGGSIKVNGVVNGRRGKFLFAQLSELDQIAWVKKQIADAAATSRMIGERGD